MTDEAALVKRLEEQNAELQRELDLCNAALQECNRSQGALPRAYEAQHDLFADFVQIVWQTDAKGNSNGFNHDWYEYTGQTHEEAQGRGWMKALHPDDVEPVRERMRAASAGKASYKAEYRVRRASDASYRWHLAWGRPLKGPDDSITCWFGSLTDIDDQKRVEAALQQAHDELDARVAERTAELARANEALRQSRDELQAVYDGMVDGFVLVDIETRQLLHTNAAMCRMLGRSEEELLNISPADMHPEEHLPELVEKFSMHVAGTCNAHDDIPVMRKDRSVFFADVHSSRILYNGRPCLLSIFRDTTERRRSQVALQESEEKYRKLVEASPDAVIVTDLQGTLLYASRRLLELHGSDNLGEFLGKKPPNFLVPENHEKYQLNLARLMQEGVMRDVEYTFFRKDGTRLSGEVSAALLKDASGKPTAIVVVLRDITERKQAYDALVKERRTLKHLLQSSDHERQLIAYEIHDGMAQQLAGAIMQFQSHAHLKDMMPQEAAKAYDAGIAMMQQAHFETRRLISGVRPPILDEEGIVAAVSHLVNEQRYHKGPKIKFHSEVRFNRLSPILENAAYRIIQEGLMNACNHSKSETVSVRLVECDAGLRITIQDWGVGFNPHTTGDDRFGLDGIRERARLLGGSTAVESHPGQGTCITVELPSVLKESC